MIYALIYLLVGVFLASCCVFENGKQGWQDPGPATVITLIWPALVVYVFLCLLNGDAKFTRGKK